MRTLLRSAVLRIYIYIYTYDGTLHPCPLTRGCTLGFRIYLLTCAITMTHTINEGSDRRYYIENAAELTMTPGSWQCGGGCGDPNSTEPVVLKYAPDATPPVSGGTPPAAVIPWVETLVTVAADNVTIKDVTIAETALLCHGTPCDQDGGVVKYNGACMCPIFSC